MASQRCHPCAFSLVDADAGLEFWGTFESNPPLEPGLTRCFDDPEMCHCECPDIQPK